MRLSWRIDGSADAPPLVLLNSVGSSTAMWEPCIAPLAEQFRIIRIDARGHGSSPTSPSSTTTIADLGEDVLDTVDELGLGRIDVAGLSLGGMTAMWLAIHRPERVGRVALLCTSAQLGPRQGWLDRVEVARSKGLDALADAVVARWITPGLAERDPALLARLRTMFTSNDAESYAQCCEAIGDMDQRTDLARIAAPTLVIGAEDDPATPVVHQQLIADAVPGARLEVLADAAHVATVEQPGRIAALLREHFRGGATLEAGFATRRAVLGNAHVDAALARSSDFSRPFQEFITRYAWGEAWTRPELSRRERSIATLSALITLGAEHELAMHLRAALRNGLTEDDLREVLMHVAIYAGVPRANRAFAVAADVLAQEETSDG